MNLNIVKDKKLFSWALYDWANSAYATIVLAGFYPIIFAENFASTIPDTERTLILGISNSSASLLLIILAPLIGLLADRKRAKKKISNYICLYWYTFHFFSISCGKGPLAACIILFWSLIIWFYVIQCFL